MEKVGRLRRTQGIERRRESGIGMYGVGREAKKDPRYREKEGGGCKEYKGRKCRERLWKAGQKWKGKEDMREVTWGFST